mmetsp:Transcript_30373/g.71094  ORF Transcript_30373/g.71094 Transcript_30373/m.71094 type:complete len:261 (-) Transcript_30373:152-934(-)
MQHRLHFFPPRRRHSEMPPRPLQRTRSELLASSSAPSSGSFEPVVPSPSSIDAADHLASSLAPNWLDHLSKFGWASLPLEWVRKLCLLGTSAYHRRHQRCSAPHRAQACAPSASWQLLQLHHRHRRHRHHRLPSYRSPPPCVCSCARSSSTSPSWRRHRAVWFGQLLLRNVPGQCPHDWASAGRRRLCRWLPLLQHTSIPQMHRYPNPPPASCPRRPRWPGGCPPYPSGAAPPRACRPGGFANHSRRPPCASDHSRGWRC